MNKLFKLFFLIGFTILLIMIVFNYLGFFSTTYDTYEAEIGELKYEMDGKGYLMYDEQILASPYSGDVIFLVNNNQRVPGKTPIARIKRRNISSDRKIDFDGKDLLIDVNKIKNNIKTIENQIAFFRKEKDVEAEEKAKDILDNLYPVLASLNEREDLYYNRPLVNYERDDSTGDIIVYSKRSGIVSLNVSPYDQVFTPKNMYILKYDELKEYKKEPVKREVVSNEGFVRIVNNSQVFLFTNIDKKDTVIFNKNKRIDIIINDTLVRAILVNKITNSDNVTLQFLLMNDFDKMSDEKIVDIKMIPAKAKGIIIDEDSIIDYKGNEGVEVLKKDNTVVFKRINRLTTVKGKVCISVDTFSYLNKDKNIVSIRTVKLYDDIIKKPKEEYLIGK